METEIIVVIIASIASLIVGIIYIIFNARISAKQNEIELKKTRIELLETQRQKIESIKFEISNRSIDLANVTNIESVEAFSRMLDFFQENSSSLFSIGHLIGNEFIIELKKLNKRINENTVKAKQNVQIDPSETQNTYNKMAELGNKMQDELDICLLNIENEIQNLLK